MWRVVIANVQAVETGLCNWKARVDMEMSEDDGWDP